MPGLFSAGVFVWGEPLTVKRGDDLEEKRLELEKRLTSITRRADSRFGHEPEEAGERALTL